MRIWSAINVKGWCQTTKTNKYMKIIYIFPGQTTDFKVTTYHSGKITGKPKIALFLKRSVSEINFKLNTFLTAKKYLKNNNEEQCIHFLLNFSQQ